MKTKQIPILLVLMFSVCAGFVYAIGSIRPFGDTEKFSSAAPTTVAQAQATAIPTDMPSAVTTRHSEATHAAPPSTKIAQATAGATTATAGASTATPDIKATQTSIPAQATFDAISTRAFVTPNPRRTDTPERAIDKTTNFLLIGTDTRTSDPNWKPSTDVLMVLFLDTANQRAAIVSLPRDLVVAIPGERAFRINTAYYTGWEKKDVESGVDVLKQVLQNNFGIRIDHWALIDFDGLNKIVDTLGGIEINAPCALSDTLDEQAFTIPAGKVQLDYLNTKRYVQSRYTTSDTSRNFRQQRVVWGMIQKGLSMNAPDRVPLLYDQLRSSVATDMTLLNFVSLIPAVYQLDFQNHPERMRAEIWKSPVVYPWVSPSGAWLYMPNYDLIQQSLDGIFDAPQIAADAPSPGECPPPPDSFIPSDAPTLTPTATPQS
ncbi:MAG: LytR family transcriptional regulator [Chloroflexota bacterium]|nr:MAG: LytR family transcriptional regulator [Chloroflexota bacterium]